MFAEVNTTNIRKSFYKKKDLLYGLKDDNDGVVEGADGVLYDSHGEELVEHTSKNTMNGMILANANKANGISTGKRPHSELGAQDTDNPESSMPTKR